ncbi:uncharacterized protein B0H64DRAFT_478377 [Chaetomium fimeti]|uniref:DUF6546 domain-containing protein n=1 Tax=Chaetomium fimeti TaxID=1854472 RepID=A0AAE0H8G7_9PEZI|nr:hypothetical protein B0H64DRAFT_478377 [Chaetomium fimeti]
MADRHNTTRRYAMILRGSTKHQPPCWTALPAEIRLLILEAITQKRHTGWASSAAVCKEWQFVIEKENFCQLNLDIPCLDDFERIGGRRQHLVYNISLDIELPCYTCRCCYTTESETWGRRNSSIVSKGIWKLFSILSDWKSARQKGLALELSAHSPSDSDHWFKHYRFDLSLVGDDDDDLVSGQDMGSTPLDDPKHGWKNSQQETPPPKLAVMRLFSAINLRFPAELPRVDAVTRFTIRRQLRRRIQPVALQLVLDKLIGLEHMVYEPWRVWNRSCAQVVDQEYAFMIQNGLPKTLKTISIFEDFDDSLVATLADPGWFGPMFPVDSVRIGDPHIGAAFASRSLDLEQLSGSYLSNAEDFFGACLQTWTWEHLRTLALTSALLQPAGGHDKVYALLSSAAATALQMPMLHTLVLWNGTRGNACAFVYHYPDRGSPYIAWRGTWDLELTHAVVEAWQAVASQVRPWKLAIEKQYIRGGVDSHADAIHRLALPCPVVAPTSLWQMRRERAYQRV